MFHIERPDYVCPKLTQYHSVEWLRDNVEGFGYVSTLES